MKKLISMTDFVLDQEKEFNYGAVGWKEYTNNTINYAKFLKQPLELWMFVPCDDNGNVLEEKSIFNTTDEEYIFYSDDFDKYQQAKERCLFEGFKEGIWGGYATFKYNIEGECLEVDNEFCQNKTIEELIKYNLQISQTAIKQIGL